MALGNEEKWSLGLVQKGGTWDRGEKVVNFTYFSVYFLLELLMPLHFLRSDCLCFLAFLTGLRRCLDKHLS